MLAQFAQDEGIDIPKINLTFSLTNLFKFFSYVTPFLLTFFIIIFSILSGSFINGLLFIAGLVIFIFLMYILKNSLKSTQSSYASPMCNLMPSPFTLKREGQIYNSPALNPGIIAFVIGYLIYPMIIYSQNLNPGLIILLIFLLGINSGVEIHANCVDISGILLGIFVGLLFSITYSSLFMISGNKKLLFFTEITNNGVQCGKLGKTQFRCYKKYDKKSKTKSEDPSKESQQPFIDNSKFVVPEFKAANNCGANLDRYKNNKDDVIDGHCRIGCGGTDSRGKPYSSHIGIEKIHYDLRKDIQTEEECKDKVLADLNTYKAYEYKSSSRQCELWKVVPGAIEHARGDSCKVFSRDGNIVPADFGRSKSRMGINKVTES